jgi:hypothetical protein
MRLRHPKFALVALAASHLAGCSVFIPEHLLGNTNVVVQSTTPAIGSRVDIGSPVSVKVKYRVENYSPYKHYYMLVCSLNTCRSSPALAVPIKGKAGTTTLSFGYSEEADMVLLVEDEPKSKTESCAANVRPEHCWPTYTNVIGSDLIPLLGAAKVP